MRIVSANSGNSPTSLLLRWRYLNQADFTKGGAIQFNAAVNGSSTIGLAACELLRFVRECAGLDQDVLARYTQKACEASSIAKCLRNGKVILHELPETVRRKAESFFPGAGSIDTRILHACKKGCPTASLGDGEALQHGGAP